MKKRDIMELYVSKNIKEYQGYGGRLNNYDEFLNYMKDNGKLFKRTIKFRDREIELPW